MSTMPFCQKNSPQRHGEKVFNTVAAVGTRWTRGHFRARSVQAFFRPIRKACALTRAIFRCVHCETTAYSAISLFLRACGEIFPRPGHGRHPPWAANFFTFQRAFEASLRGDFASVKSDIWGTMRIPGNKARRSVRRSVPSPCRASKRVSGRSVWSVFSRRRARPLSQPADAEAARRNPRTRAQPSN